MTSTRTKVGRAVALVAAAMIGLTGCGASVAEPGGSSTQLSLVGFAVPEAANKLIQEDWARTPEGRGVAWRTSYGASGDQSRAVESGLDADYVHFSLESDVSRLVDAGLVAEDWKDNEHRGIVSQSVVVLVVRKGNPKDIQGWDDLVKPGVGIITPNPGSSGSARWNILGAWGHVIANGGTEADAKAFVTKFFENTVALPGSGRDATTSFLNGNGDVLISYENEAILARQKGEDFDYVVPEDTLLIENPGAVTKDADPLAAAWLEYLWTTEAQKDFAATGFRPLVDVGALEVEGANDPSNPFPAPAELLTIDEDFGGWGEAKDKFFDEEAGIIPGIQKATSKQ